MTLQVSVVVPTYRRADLLERCLAALAAQDLPWKDYEVIVADAANLCSTHAQVEHWNTGRHLPLFRYVEVHGKNHGPAAARNAGWRAAGGAIIAFTDDDCIPSSAWLREGVGAFVEGVQGVCGRVLVPLPPHPTDYELNTAGLETAPFVTANCFYRRSVLESAGGFDERFEIAWREDSDLYYTLLEKEGITDGQFIEVKEAEVVHPVRPEGWGISLRQQRKSAYNALLYKKHPQLYRQNISREPPWQYYRIVLAMAGVVVSLFLGRKWMAMIFGAAWLGLSSLFTLQRLKKTSHAPTHVIEMAITSSLIPPLSVFWRLRGAVKYRTLFL